jgi:hypothetical protein
VNRTNRLALIALIFTLVPLAIFVWDVSRVLASPRTGRARASSSAQSIKEKSGASYPGVSYGRQAPAPGEASTWETPPELPETTGLLTPTPMNVPEVPGPSPETNPTVEPEDAETSPRLNSSLALPSSGPLAV